MVRAVTVWGGVPKQRVGAQRIVLIRAQRPRNKTISCIGQFVTQGLLPSVAVLGCGFSLPVCGFVRFELTD